MLTVINNFLFLFPPKCFDDCHRHARALNYRQIFFFSKAFILFFETWKSKFLLPCQFSFFCFTHKYINSQSCLIPFSQLFNYGRFQLHMPPLIIQPIDPPFSTPKGKNCHFRSAESPEKITKEQTAEDQATNYSFLHGSLN